MSTVTVNGNTYSSAGEAANDMRSGGHRTHLLPMLADAVVDLAAKQSAAAASAATATTQAGLATTNGAAQVALAAAQVVLAEAEADAAAASASTATTQAGNASASASAASVSAAQAAASAASLYGTSATSLLIAAVSKTFTTQSGEAYSAGDWITATSAANLANWMYGQVTSYSGATLIVDVQVINGGGTYADWNLSISAARGATGATGPQGIQGDSGISVTLTGTLTVYVSQQITYTITNYSAFATYSVAATAGSISRVGDTITYTAPASAQGVTLTVTMDGNDTTFPLTILAAGIATPTNSAPTNGATNQNGTVALASSAFSWLGVSDTHASSDWQLASDSGFNTIVQSTTTDTTNKVTWTVAGLSVSQTYYWRVRHTGAANGTSSWSTGTSFATKATFGGLIGTQGGQGFGVGVYPETLPSGFTAMTGYDDPAHANYGNYQYSDGSITVFVPRFYYRIGNAGSPRYATYGANAIDIAGIDAYATEAAANTAGYAMHRAFKDGGADKGGFFIDKYLASKNSTTSCKSIADADPISLTTNASYNPSNGMTGCTGILADAVVLARSRGAAFNVASVFMYSACALLATAHAQASTTTTYCAWYDATNNFPKGCNSSLADTNDASVTYAASYSTKPKTRATANFAKTTHNGQACGVADLNGSMYQAALGITNPGTSGTDTTLQGDGNAYVLKSSVALASLTSGWTSGASGTDAWGDAAHLGLLYDSTANLFPWGATTGWTYFGNGANQVFSGATSGTDWLQTGCGIQDTTNGTSAGGTALFGADGCYQYNTANLFPLCAGYWDYAANAGVFYRYWGVSRSLGNDGCGFRAGAYGS